MDREILNKPQKDENGYYLIINNKRYSILLNPVKFKSNGEINIEVLRNLFGCIHHIPELRVKSFIIKPHIEEYLDCYTSFAEKAMHNLGFNMVGYSEKVI